MLERADSLIDMSRICVTDAGGHLAYAFRTVFNIRQWKKATAHFSATAGSERYSHYSTTYVWN